MISLIVAFGLRGELGLNGKLPWKIKEDLQYFRDTTWGGTLIVGRKTAESLPALTNRKIVVISSGASLKKAIEDHKKENCFLAGGVRIYEEGLQYAQRLYFTRIQDFFQADVFFPKVDLSPFALVHKKEMGKVFNTEDPSRIYEIWERVPTLSP